MTVIRRTKPADSGSIARLLGQLGYPSAAEDIPSRIADMEREGGVAFVAVDGGDNVVGLASGCRHATLHAGGQVAYITALVTDVDARGKGIGRALVEELERWALSHDCARISVTSAEHRADAHEFYPRCGFPYTGRRFGKVLSPRSDSGKAGSA
jgi:GNAT superfamily N-acetyltransferase